MEANELRIGNYVNVIYNNLIGEVFNITRTTVRVFVDNELEDLNPSIQEIEPIPLTEEWLLNFGFETDLEATVYLDLKNSFLYLENDKVWLVDEENNKPICKIKYVHQLQNLYFSLTGKELTIKEKPLTNSEGLSS